MKPEKEDTFLRKYIQNIINEAIQPPIPEHLDKTITPTNVMNTRFSGYWYFYVCEST